MNLLAELTFEFKTTRQGNNYTLANIHLFKISNRNTRKRCETCLKLTIKISGRRHRLVLVFLLLTLKTYLTPFSRFSVDFEQVNVSWHKCTSRKKP